LIMIDNNKMRCLVLGGSGFLGRALCRRLLASGFGVRSVSRSGRPRVNHERWHEEVEWIEAPIGSDISISALANIDVVFHLASTTHPSTSNLEMADDLSSNAVATIRILDAAARLPIRQFVFVSSGGTVYGAPQNNPIDETHPTNPLCSYGIHKLAIEKYLHLFEHLYGLKSATLRVSNIYGETQDCAKPVGAIAHFVDRAIRNEPIEIWGDGSIIRDYVHVDDVVEALLKAATYTGAERLFNIGSGDGLSLNSLIDMIKKYSPCPISVRYKASRSFDVRANILDITKAFKELTWQPRVDLEERLARMFKPKIS
jgi:UDP-glucose 4-epimerase